MDVMDAVDKVYGIPMLAAARAAATSPPYHMTPTAARGCAGDGKCTPFAEQAATGRPCLHIPEGSTAKSNAPECGEILREGLFVLDTTIHEFE
jgi:hypothetical protein